MTDVKRLLEQATPLPWRREHDDGWKIDDVLGSDWEPVIGVESDAGRAGPNAALIVHAVNSLPAYEEAVDALERLLHTLHALETIHPTTVVVGYETDDVMAVHEAGAALSRLRGEQ